MRTLMCDIIKEEYPNNQIKRKNPMGRNFRFYRIF